MCRGVNGLSPLARCVVVEGDDATIGNAALDAVNDALANEAAAGALHHLAQARGSGRGRAEKRARGQIKRAEVATLQPRARARRHQGAAARDGDGVHPRAHADCPERFDVHALHGPQQKRGAELLGLHRRVQLLISDILEVPLGQRRFLFRDGSLHLLRKIKLRHLPDSRR